MGDEGYYPPGAAYDPYAPYNQEKYEKKEFEMFIVQTLTKDTKVTTDDYIREVDYAGIENGGYIENINTEDTDWEEVYRQEHYTPLELIEEFSKFLYEKYATFKDSMSDEEKFHIEHLMQECSDWTCEETITGQT